MKTTKKYYRVDRREISFLRFIFESYEGITMFSTIDQESGIVEFHISPGCESEVEMILNDLQNNITIEPIINFKNHG